MVVIDQLSTDILALVQAGDKTFAQIQAGITYPARRDKIKSHIAYLVKNRRLTLTGPFLTGTFHWIDPATVTTRVFNQVYLDSDLALQDDDSHDVEVNITRAGVHLPAGSPGIGFKIAKVAFYLKKFGTPVGNITFTVRNASDTVVATISTPVGALTTSYQKIEQTLNTPRILAAGDKILVENAGTLTDHIVVGTSIIATIPIGFRRTQYDAITPAYVDDTNTIASIFDSTQVPA